MARFTYKITDEAVVEFFDAENLYEDGAPNIAQPFHPATPTIVWTKEEAKEWAEKALEEMNNPPEPLPVKDLAAELAKLAESETKEADSKV